MASTLKDWTCTVVLFSRVPVNPHNRGAIDQNEYLLSTAGFASLRVRAWLKKFAIIYHQSQVKNQTNFDSLVSLASAARIRLDGVLSC